MGSTEQNIAVGVVLCDDGGSLAQCLNLEALKKRLHALPGVIEVKQCSTLDKKDDGIAVLQQAREVTERVVLAGSGDDTFGPRLAEAIHKSKLNDALVQGGKHRRTVRPGAQRHNRRNRQSLRAYQCRGAAPDGLRTGQNDNHEGMS